MIKAAFISLCLATCAHAHSLHQSTAEAEYNPQTQKLEVSLTVFINDLELALIRHTERLISLEKTPTAELDAAIQSYLAKTFIVTDAAGKAVKIQWAGRGIEVDSAKSDEPAMTLFFEVALPDGLGGSTLKHTLFHDLFKDQTNLLLLKAGRKKSELSFRRESFEARMALP